MHEGAVTAGEIGALKKEIVYTGDVLNTTARLQSLTREYQTDLLVSGSLRALFPENVPYGFEQLGSASLRGKSEETVLFTARLK